MFSLPKITSRHYFPFLLLWTAFAYTYPEESKTPSITIGVTNRTSDSYWLFLNGKRVDINSKETDSIEAPQQKNATLRISRQWPGLLPYLWCLISRRGLLHTTNSTGFSVRFPLPHVNSTISITEPELGNIFVHIAEDRRNTRYKMARLLQS